MTVLQAQWAALNAWVIDLGVRLSGNLASSSTSVFMLRLASICSGVVVLGLMMASAHRHNIGGSAAASHTPREVLYSSFLTLVQSGQVTQARFDDSNNVYFMVKPEVLQILRSTTRDGSTQPVAADAAPAAPAAAAAASKGRASTGTALASTSAAAAPASPAAAAPSSFKASVSQFERHFYARRVPDDRLVSLLASRGVDFGALGSSWTQTLSKVMTTLLILWLPLMPLFFIMKRTLDGRTGSGRKPSNAPRKAEVVTFADVAGVGGAKEELVEVVMCLRDASRYSKLNAKMPTGVLLSGPPGTGKTLLAKAVAGEAGVPFFAISASEFVELYVGRGAARVRELFAEARKRAPCVVFIDELDAVGSRRGLGLNEERDQTLNQLLTELDGFEGRGGILFMAATNRPQVLDPALLRPGRLSRRVEVPLPDLEGRAQILRIHMSKIPLEPPMSVEEAAGQIARISGGFSGAELSNVVNESALMAARRNADSVSLGDLAEGVFRTKYGANAGSVGPAQQLRRQVSDVISSWGSGRVVRSNPAQ